MVGARSTRDDHQALAVSIFSGLAAPGTQPEGTDTSQKHSTGVVAHDSLERGRGRDKVCGKRGGRRGRGAGGDTVDRGAEGVRVSFELDENEQQPSKLLGLLTMSTDSRQPPRHDSRSVQIVTGHREH